MAVSVVDPDAILVQEHLGGERDAFDVLYRRYFPRLVRLCTRLTKDQAAAEDIAQETLVRAHDHLERFDQARSMWPWLKTIAKNLLIDHTRSQQRELLTEDGPIEGPHIDHGWTEERDVLAQALSKLPPRQQTAVALKYIEDWDGEQAAEFLGLSGLAFRQILHRARLKLQAEYRKIAEPVMGAILVPFGLLRRLAHDTSMRMRHVAARPEAVKAVAAVTAINLVVAGAAVFGGAGHGASPSAARSAPPNNQAASVPTDPALGSVDSTDSHGKEASAQNLDAETAAAGQGSQSQSESAGLAGTAGDRGRDVAQGLTEPNQDVNQPEDAQLSAATFSPRFGTDQTVYAAGVAACRAPECPPVLFRSTDSGSSWTRLPAEGFHGTQILLPPAYGVGDNRIFAMGSLGLEVSEDGGESFHPAAAVGPAAGIGSSAISPAFNSGDGTILIGDHALMQYRDETKTVGPSKPLPGRGPLHPAFSPSYEQDGLLLVGGLQVSGVSWAPAVFRCLGDVCSASPLPVSTSETPRVRPAPDFAESGVTYSFTSEGLFLSSDRGESFSRVGFPWQAELNDVAPGVSGRLFAAVLGRTGTPGELYVSGDYGTTWTVAADSLLSVGVTSVQVSGDHVLAALHGGGIACSSDGGETWAPRCAPATAS